MVSASGGEISSSDSGGGAVGEISGATHPTAPSDPGPGEATRPPLKPAPQEPKVTKLKSSKADYMFGHMTTKVFQMREDQLNELGRANRDTAVASAIASGALAFAFDVTKDLFLASTPPPNAFIFFAGVSAACWGIGIVAAVIAAMKWTERTSLIDKIRKQTDFKGQDAQQA